MAVLVVFLASMPAVSLGLHSIGVRILLPTFGSPFAVGLEATVSLDEFLACGSFFLTAEGKALMTVGADLPVGDEESTGTGYLRLTTGLCYVDTTRLLPTLVVGGGMAWRTDVLDGVGLGFAAELLYPFAFPVPMLSLSGGWRP